MIPKHAQQVLDEINRLGYKLKGQDKGFIQSVKRHIELDRMLTSGQAKWLQDIYARASGNNAHQPREYI